MRAMATAFSAEPAKDDGVTYDEDEVETEVQIPPSAQYPITIAVCLVAYDALSAVFP